MRSAHAGLAMDQKPISQAALSLESLAACLRFDGNTEPVGVLLHHRFVSQPPGVV